MPINVPQVYSGMSHQLRENDLFLLDRWLREESYIISILHQIDHRLQFRMHPNERNMILRDKQDYLNKLIYVRRQIAILKQRLYGTR